MINDKQNLRLQKLLCWNAQLQGKMWLQPGAKNGFVLYGSFFLSGYRVWFVLLAYLNLNNTYSLHCNKCKLGYFEWQETALYCINTTFVTWTDKIIYQHDHHRDFRWINWHYELKSLLLKASNSLLALAWWATALGWFWCPVANSSGDKKTCSCIEV